MWTCLDKIVAVAGGCVVAAISTQADPGTLVGGAMGATGLFAFWREQREKLGPENSYQLSRIRQSLLDEIEHSEEWAGFDPALRDAADYRLGIALVDCFVKRDDLARSAVTTSGFPRAATEIVLNAVANRDPFFASNDPEADPNARRFATLVIQRALALAWADRRYFAQFEPDLLKWMAQGIGESRDDLKIVLDLLHSMQGTLAAIAADKDVAVSALGTIARSFVELDPTASAAEIVALVTSEAERLREMEQRLAILEDQASRLSNHDNRLRPSLREAREMLEAGSLAAAESLIDDALQVYEEIRDQQLAILAETELQMAEAYALKASSARARLDYRAAAQAFDAASILTHGNARLFYLTEAASCLLDYGTARGARDAIDQSILKYNQVINSIDRQCSPMNWARIQNDLGIALRRRASIFLNRSDFSASVVAFNRAISVFYDLNQLDFLAGSKHNLGTTLSSWGFLDKGVEKQRRAVEALRDSLSITSRDNNPTAWIQRRNGLANTLRIIGARTNNLRSLRDAVNRIQEILSIIDIDEEPIIWIHTKLDLAAAHRSLGMRQPGVTHLRLAIEHYMEALEHVDVELRPMFWVSIHTALGDAWGGVWNRKRGAVNLTSSIRCYEAALSIATREAMPEKWALTTLGLIMIRLEANLIDARELDEAENRVKEASLVLRSNHHLQSTSKIVVGAVAKALKRTRGSHAQVAKRAVR